MCKSKRIKKWFIICSTILLLILVFGYIYIATDNPYKMYDGSVLSTVYSEEITTQPAPNTKDTSQTQYLKSDGIWFSDKTGRKMLLRGLNLGGSTKLPYRPFVPSHEKNNFFDGENISFIGRPFPLEEADRHFERIQKWGFNFIRFLVTWEAVEHRGPGIYDEDYLTYVYQIIKKADAYDINVFIDPHQDVWSRYSGGSGAPKWTFDLVGLDVSKFNESGAAVVHNTYGDTYPRMIWPTNYGKLATATMFTLFFGGNDFAPKTTIDSVPVQEYLQTHFINAIQQVAIKVKDLPNVVGFETMNEPTLGYIGKNLNDWSFLKNGVSPTFYEGMVAGSGHAVSVETWSVSTTALVQEDNQLLNPNHISAWLKGYEQIWKSHGIWNLDKEGKPQLLKPDYFVTDDPNGTYFKPFADRFSKAIREIKEEYLIFIEPPLQTKMPTWHNQPTQHLVNATHWYDAVTLFTKKYIPYFTVDNTTLELVIGKKNTRKYFEKAINDIKTETAHTMGKRPTIIGEFGVPMDLNRAIAYEDNDFREQEKALDRTFRAIEKELLHYALWTYVEDNSNERGDNWNGEDLSIFSVDQQLNPKDINSGGRALNAVIRPYPYKTSGKPTFQQFNMDEGEYIYNYKADSSDFPTEIFVPDWHYGNGFELYYSNGMVHMDKKKQLLLHYPEEGMESTLIIKRKNK